MITSRVWQIYDDVGFTACATGNLNIAEKMFTAAIESCASDKAMQKEKVKSMIGLADTLALRGQPEEAFKLYGRVVNALSRMGSHGWVERSMLSYALERLAYFHADQHSYEDALKLLKRAVRIAEQITGADRRSLAPKWLKLSFLQVKLNNVDAALVCLHRARALKLGQPGRS